MGSFILGSAQDMGVDIQSTPTTLILKEVLGMDEFEKEVREAIAKIDSALNYLKAYEQGELSPYATSTSDFNESAWLEAVVNLILERPMSKFLAEYVKPEVRNRQTTNESD